MNYRGFAQPPFALGPHYTTHWMDWLSQEAAIPSVAGRVEGSCEDCYGAVGLDGLGIPYGRCYHCRSYGTAVDALVPIVYSIDRGLESMLHKFKDWREHGLVDYSWLVGPLGALLHSFWSEHSTCVTQSHEGVDVVLSVPSNNAARGYDHLDLINNAVAGGPTLPLQQGVLSRNPAVPRPARGALTPDAYDVSDDRQVQGARVLLFDDTWTSGSSTASAAARLKESGAASVVVLTLGRQLNLAKNYGSTEQIAEVVLERGWTGECVCCE